MNLELELNPKQKEAVVTTEGPILVLAGAGSGKTRSLTYRIAYLIKQGVSPQNILTVTFTNKAAQDMKRKIDELIKDKSLTDELWMGTFHGICLKIISKNLNKLGYKPDFLIYDTEDSKGIIKKLINKYNFSLEVDLVKYVIDNAKMKLLNPSQMKSEAENSNQENLAFVYSEYEKRLQRDNAFDFNDLIKKTIELFENNPDILKKYQNQFKYVQIDEYQDTNYSQYKLATMLAKPKENIFVVGDDFQCQPPNTNVLTPNGYKKIKDINPKKDKIVSYDRRGSSIVGLTEKYSYNFQKASREYNGKMFKITTEDGKTSKATGNHKWIAKWTDRSYNGVVVYIMKKDNRYRTGWCKLFNNQGAFNLGTRARFENADKAWILKVFDNKADGYKWENIISSKYGIPRITFEDPNNNNGCLNEKIIDEIYNSLDLEKMSQRVNECLLEFNKMPEYPDWSNNIGISQRGGTSIQKIQSCNLLPGLMKLPVHVEGKKVKWVDIQNIEVEQYEGKVYSLNVEKHHKYISNGMVTCNSIYAFRGADVSNILGFEKDYPDAKVIKLERNYRCPNNIIKASNNIISKNEEQAEKNVWTSKKSKEKIMICEAENEKAESDFVINTIKALENSNQYSYSDMAILYRCNYQSREFEKMLIEENIPHQIVGSLSFFQRKEIKILVSLVNLMLNPNHIRSLTRIINLIPNGVGPNTLSKIAEYANEKNINILNVLKELEEIDGIGKVTANRIRDFYKTNIFPLIDIAKTNELIHDKVKDAFETIDLLSFLKDDENFQDRKDNIYEFLRLAKNYQMKDFSRDLSSFVRDIKLMSDQEDIDENEESVKLMTVHACKGLEYPVIFMVGMEEDTFPFKLALEEEGGVQEERRLCYVGMTRAEERLFLSYRNMTFGFKGPEYKKKSRFIKDIPFSLCKNIYKEDTSK